MSHEQASFFPSFVAYAELRPPAAADPLFPEEEAFVKNAVPKRKDEFARGRACARRALAQLSIAPAALPMNPDRSALWPAQVLGSITHTEDFCAAAVARDCHVRGIGIDAEVRARVEPRLWSHIASPSEIVWFEAAASEAEAHERATLLFSAKEAFYKAQFCVSKTFVNFHEVELRFDSFDAFTVELRVDVASAFRRGATFEGRYRLLTKHVLTHVILRAD